MRTTTHPESIQPSPARAILYQLSSKRDSPAYLGEDISLREDAIRAKVGLI